MKNIYKNMSLEELDKELEAIAYLIRTINESMTGESYENDKKKLDDYNERMIIIDGVYKEKEIKEENE